MNIMMSALIVTLTILNLQTVKCKLSKQKWNDDDLCFLAGKGPPPFVCPEGSSRSNVTVNVRDRLEFKTQTGRLTPANVDCGVDYVLGNCTRVALNCRFRMRGRGKDCAKGDRVTLSFGSKTNRYN